MAEKKSYDHDFGVNRNQCNMADPKQVNAMKEQRESLRREALDALEDSDAWVLVSIIDEEGLCKAVKEEDAGNMKKHHSHCSFMGMHKSALSQMMLYSVQQALYGLSQENDTLRKYISEILNAEEKEDG